LLWIFSTFLLKLQALLYLIAIVYVLKKYKKIFLENYAYGNIDIYKWLSRIVLVFLITLPVTIIKDFSNFSNHQEIFTWSIIVLTTTALIMLCWFILKALYTPEIFRGIDPELKPARKFTNRKNEIKSIETGLGTKYSAIIEQLRKHMIEKEPFLEPTLTLQDLALQINIPVRELSILINQHTGQHFFDFINKYRIEKAVQIIEKSTKREFTIQQIYFEVGFNSKSSFNTAFKKHTQRTPSEYKNLQSK
jgi:AraC-like DNA-binding protein